MFYHLITTFFNKRRKRKKKIHMYPIRKTPAYLKGFEPQLLKLFRSFSNT